MIEHEGIEGCAVSHPLAQPLPSTVQGDQTAPLLSTRPGGHSLPAKPTFPPRLLPATTFSPVTVWHRHSRPSQGEGRPSSPLWPWAPGPLFPPPHPGPGRSPAGRGGAWGSRPRVQQVAPARGRAPRAAPASPQHGWRALPARGARAGAPQRGRPSASMSRPRGPGRGPLAPGAGREVGPGAGGCSQAGRGRARCPRLPPVVHTPFGRAAGLQGARCAERALPPCRPGFGVRGPEGEPGAPRAARLPAGRPHLRRGSGGLQGRDSMQTERGRRGERAPEDTELALDCLFTPR